MFIKSIEAVLILFTLIFIGWVLSKKGLLTDEVKVFLNKVIVTICIPALTISNLFTSFSREFLTSSLKVLMVIAIFSVIIIIIVRIIISVFKIDKNRAGIFTAMSVVSNIMFFGLPIILSLYGESSVPYVLCYYMINTAVFWSICVPMIKKESGHAGDDSLYANIKNILNVPFMTIIVSSLLIYNNIGLPDLVINVSRQLSNMVTPLACIVIGRIIYDIDFKAFNIDRATIVVIVTKLVLSPIIMFIVLSFFDLPIIAVKVLTILAAMPIMMQVAITTDLYEGDSLYATTGVALTTLLTLLTAPVYSVILDYIL